MKWISLLMIIFALALMLLFAQKIEKRAYEKVIEEINMQIKKPSE